MPFMLYDVAERAGRLWYSHVGVVQIAGNTGPLASVARNRNTAGVIPFRWHASSDDLVAAIPNGSKGQEILIDLKPSAAKNVSLYRLLDVWGFSYENWTPLALRLETFFVDREEREAEAFKKQFDDSSAERSKVGEFLYVQGGVQGGTWNWGQVGRVNGALLWKDAFDYLVGELGKKL